MSPLRHWQKTCEQAIAHGREGPKLFLFEIDRNPRGLKHRTQVAQPAPRTCWAGVCSINFRVVVIPKPRLAMRSGVRISMRTQPQTTRNPIAYSWALPFQLQQ